MIAALAVLIILVCSVQVMEIAVMRMLQPMSVRYIYKIKNLSTKRQCMTNKLRTIDRFMPKKWRTRKRSCKWKDSVIKKKLNGHNVRKIVVQHNMPKMIMQQNTIHLLFHHLHMDVEILLFLILCIQRL